MTRSGALAVLALFGLTAYPTLGSAQNLVVNPGFETGDLTGWTTMHSPQGSSFGVGAFNQHSGAYATAFSSTGPIAFVDDDSISQVLPTVVGHNYSLDFFLLNNIGPANDFRALVNGAALLTLLDQQSFAYTEYTFTFLGAGSDTLTFAGRQVPGAFYLDDISVFDLGPAAVPEPGSVALLLGLGATSAGFLIRRKRARKAA